MHDYTRERGYTEYTWWYNLYASMHERGAELGQSVCYCCAHEESVSTYNSSYGVGCAAFLGVYYDSYDVYAQCCY